MRIEANKHPAAIHIREVLVQGVPLLPGTCKWVDLEKNEACIYRTGADGRPLIEDGNWVEHTIHATLAIRIDDQHRHLLSWRPAP
jgi:hypothetical protein